MRTWYTTDVNQEDPEYVGSFSAPFPRPNPERQIVDVDWSERGVVQVTWLVPE